MALTEAEQAELAKLEAEEAASKAAAASAKPSEPVQVPLSLGGRLGPGQVAASASSAAAVGLEEEEEYDDDEGDEGDDEGDDGEDYDDEAELRAALEEESVPRAAPRGVVLAAGMPGARHVPASVAASMRDEVSKKGKPHGRLF